MTMRAVIHRIVHVAVLLAGLQLGISEAASSDSLKVLPEAGRTVFLTAFAEATTEIRIEICVLEDPQILAGLQQAIQRGVRVRAIVDNGKYHATELERQNLKQYVIDAGGQVHLSNPIFPRSFPKVILIDNKKVLLGSACLDTTTFQQYRDYVFVSGQRGLIADLARLFENDWRFSAVPELQSPPFNPTPRIVNPRLAIGPVSAASKLTALIQSARKTLDVTSELLGNAALESELTAAVARGVRVRLISPLCVNGATTDIWEVQNTSLKALQDWGVDVHVTGPDQTFQMPYMHARTMLVDGAQLYVGSISFSPNSTTFGGGWLAAISSVVIGSLTAGYLTTPVYAAAKAYVPLLAGDASSEHAIGFLVGLTAMLICEGVLRFMRAWSRNPTIPINERKP